MEEKEWKTLKMAAVVFHIFFPAVWETTSSNGCVIGYYEVLARESL